MKNRMKKFLLLGITILISVTSQAQTKILFLGNSFTYTYNIPTLFEGLANSAGISVYVDVNAQAGMAVADEQIVGHVNDAVSQSKIASQNWDYIVVQDNMGDYVNSVGVISSNCGNANVTLYNQIKANNPCTRIIYFAGWGPVGGVYNGDNTTACIDRIHGNMIFLNNNIGNEIVTPIGKSWNASFTQLPSVNLFYSDNVHPSLEGSYLAAATIFTTIFKQDPTNLSYTGGVNTTTATTMRSIAYSTVTNATYLSTTHLSNYTPTISVNGNVLTASGSYSNYQWYLNGSPVGTNSNTYTALQTGNYQVEATNAAGCLIRSFVKPVTVVMTGIVEELATNFELLPVANNVFDFVSGARGTISIFDTQGKMLASFEKTDDHMQLDLSNNAHGVYLIVLTNSSMNVSRKIMVN